MNQYLKIYRYGFLYGFPAGQFLLQTNGKTRYPLQDNGFLWSCYPDLNWGPHPYQRSKTNIFDQKQDKNIKNRRIIPLLQRLKNCKGASNRTGAGAAICNTTPVIFLSSPIPRPQASEASAIHRIAIAVPNL